MMSSFAFSLFVVVALALAVIALLVVNLALFGPRFVHNFNQSLGWYNGDVFLVVSSFLKRRFCL